MRIKRNYIDSRTNSFILDGGSGDREHMEKERTSSSRAITAVVPAVIAAGRTVIAAVSRWRPAATATAATAAARAAASTEATYAARASTEVIRDRGVSRSAAVPLAFWSQRAVWSQPTAARAEPLE